MWWINAPVGRGSVRCDTCACGCLSSRYDEIRYVNSLALGILRQLMTNVQKYHGQILKLFDWYGQNNKLIYLILFTLDHRKSIHDHTGQFCQSVLPSANEIMVWPTESNKTRWRSRSYSFIALYKLVNTIICLIGCYLAGHNLAIYAVLHIIMAAQTISFHLEFDFQHWICKMKKSKFLKINSQYYCLIFLMAKEMFIEPWWPILRIQIIITSNLHHGHLSLSMSIRKYEYDNEKSRFPCFSIPLTSCWTQL